MSAGLSTAAARNHGGGGGPATCTTHDELVQARASRGRPSWLSHTAAAPPSWTWLIAIRERRTRATAVVEVVGRSVDRAVGHAGGLRTRPSLQGSSRRRKYPTRDDRDERETRRTHDATEHDDTAPSGNGSRGNLVIAMRRRRSPPPPPPRALARACTCARAMTRPELGCSGGGGGRSAVQRNDGSGVVPETPHARRGARVPRVRSIQIDRFCARSTTRRARFDGGDKGRDGGWETPDGRRSCARGACPSGFTFVPPEGCFGVASRG